MLYKQLSLFFKCTILWELLLIDLVFKIIFQMKAYFRRANKCPVRLLN